MTNKLPLILGLLMTTACGEKEPEATTEPSGEPSEEPSEEPSGEPVDLPEVDTTPQNPKRDGCGYVVHSKMEYFLIVILVLLYRRRL